MKNTVITIKGSAFGNIHIANLLHNGGLISRKEHGSNLIIMLYESKKSARIALKSAYESMVMEEPDLLGKNGGINYVRGKSLNYDASRALILD